MRRVRVLDVIPGMDFSRLLRQPTTGAAGPPNVMVSGAHVLFRQPSASTYIGSGWLSSDLMRRLNTGLIGIYGLNSLDT